MPRFSLLTTAVLILAACAFGACTVQHYHPDGNQGYGQQGYAQQSAQGAPGQTIDPYASYQDNRYQRPGAPYAVAPAPQRERRADSSSCNCDCEDHRYEVPASVAPRSAIPRGPVTPSQIESDPADWLE